MRVANLSCLTMCLSIAIDAGAASQAPGKHYQFHLWQIEPDGSRLSVGRFGGGGYDDIDFRIWIKPSRRLTGNTDYRLDGDFVAHRLGDSTIMVSEITAVRELRRDQAPGDSITRAQLEEETYRRTIVVRGGASGWFYPFGIPERGERGVAFEITVYDSVPPELPVDRGRDYLLSNHAYGIEMISRLNRARIRLEIRDAASGWRTVFEGDALTRIPVRVPLRGKGARGQDLVFELDAPEWGFPEAPESSMCWRWYWADRQPPGGEACAATRRGTAVQPLGADLGQLRVTVLAAY